MGLWYDAHGGLFTELFDVLDKLKSMGLCRMLFLEAAPETIIKRYKETRRRHPLRGETDSLEEAVRRERELMAPVKERATFRGIDTSPAPPPPSRASRGCSDRRGSGAMTVNVTSFGFKYGLPPEATAGRVHAQPLYICDPRP